MDLCAIRCTKRESSQRPNSQILMTGEGRRGIRERFIFYTQRNHDFRICLPKKITTFLAYPQNSLSPFFATPKIPFVFFATQRTNFGQNFKPKKIIRLPPSLKYVSGPPGEELFRRMLDERTAGLPSAAFLDTDSLGSNVTLDERYRHPNDKGSITYRYLLRELSL